MANFLCRTLVRTTALPSYLLSASKPRAIRCFSTQPESLSYAEVTASEVKASEVEAEVMASELEAKVVERIENCIHYIIVQRSTPEWLPFVPGASYWVPPRPSSYGVSEVVHKLANALTSEEYLSLVTLQGWPSSAFYIENDESRSEMSTAENLPVDEG